MSDISSVLSDALERGYDSQLRWVKTHVDGLLESNGLRIVEGGSDYRELVERVCWRLLELSRLSLDRVKRDWSTDAGHLTERAHEALSTEIGQTSPQIALPSYVPQDGLSGVSKTIVDAISSYTDYKLSQGSWDAKTEADAAGAYKLLVEYLGAQTALNHVTREQLRGFVNILARLPVNYARKGHLKGLSLEQLVKVGESGEEKTASGSTVKKKMVFVKALFSYAYKEEWVEKDRASGIVVPKGEVLRRVPYSSGQLNELFSHYNLEHEGARYWVPRIALTTGMRSNEILQLGVSDIRLVNDIPVFDLNRAVDTETGKAKKLKRDNSERLVPVPKALIDRGFMKYVGSLKEGRLFSEVKLGADGSYSSTYGKEFNGQLTALGLKPSTDSGEKLDFHSFRHTFRANCRAYGVPEEYADLIGGWTDQKVRTSGADYGVHYEAFVAKLKSVIDSINYDDVPEL